MSDYDLNSIKRHSFSARFGSAIIAPLADEPEFEFERSVEESVKMIQESMKLCNTTKKPEVFFKRYDIVLYQLDVLSRLEKFVPFSGDKPSKKLAQVKQVKNTEIDKMIDRAWNDTLEKVEKLKTDSAKIRKITGFRDEMDKYSGFMSDANIDKYESLCESYLE